MTTKPRITVKTLLDTLTKLTGPGGYPNTAYIAHYDWTPEATIDHRGTKYTVLGKNNAFALAIELIR